MTKTNLCLLLPFLIAFSQTFPTTGATFLKSVKRNPMKLRTEKLSHFHFYWHDTFSGSKPTAMTMVQVPGGNIATFGTLNMMDDPLTEKPEIGSKLLGRAQGFTGEASQGEIALLMAVNLVFSTGKYNGSTLTILGWNPVLHKVREMPVVGGSGIFRFARGYVQARTYTLNKKTGDAVLEYNVHVMHY